MKGLFIVIFALGMFAFGSFCCEKKQPAETSGAEREMHRERPPL